MDVISKLGTAVLENLSKKPRRLIDIKDTRQTQAEVELVGHPASLAEFRFPLQKWISIFSVLGCLLLLATAVFFLREQYEMIQARQWVIHTHNVLRELESIQTLITDAETGQRGFIITHKPSYVQPFNNAASQLPEHLASLRELVKDNPIQTKAIERLEPIMADKMAELNETIDLAKSAGPSYALKLIMSDRGLQDMREIRSILSDMEKGEQKLLVKTTDNLNSHTQSFHAGVYLLMGAAVAVVGWFLFVVSGFLRQSYRLQKERQLSEIAEQERLFHRLFDVMPQLAWTARPDGFIDFYNRGWYEYTGTTYDEMKGWGWERVHDPKTLPAVIQGWRLSLETGTPFEMAFPLRRKDGAFRWFLTRVNPIVDRDGNITRWVGIHTDIDEQTVELQSVNTELKASEQRLNIALDASCLGVFDLDWTTGSAWHSLKHDQIFGYERLQPHWTYQTFVSHVVEQDRQQVLDSIERALKTGAFDFECRIRRVDNGLLRWISVHGKSFKDPSTQSVRLAGTVTDITQKKEQSLLQEYQAAIVQWSPDAIISKTLDGIVTSWNQGAELLYGYTAEEMIGRSIAVLFPPERPDNLSEILAKVARGERIEPYETTRLTKSGKVIHVSLALSPVKDATGKIVRACVIARDVETSRRMQEELRRTKELLQSVFQSSPEGILIADQQGILRTSNAQAQQMLGYASEELVGKSIEMLLPERFRQVYANNEHHYLEGSHRLPAGTRLELYGLRKDGSEIPVDVVLSPLRADSDMVMAVIRDLTEQKKLEAERRKLEAEFKAQDVLLKSPKTDPTLLRRARILSQDLAAAALIYSVVVVVGCVYNVDVLRNFTPWGRLIPINAAICMAATAIGILMANRPGPLAKRGAVLAGAVAGVIGAITLCEWIFGWNAGIDQLIVPELHMRYSVIPGRMPNSTAVAYLCAGLSLLALSFNRWRLSQVCAFIVLVIGLITLSGHSFAFVEMLSFGSRTLIAFPMSVALLVAGIALLLIHPDRGMAHVIVSPNSGGRVLRRLLPILILVPSLGAITGIGRRSSMDTLILVVVTTLLFPLAIWLVARAIDKLDQQKEQAADRAFTRREELEVVNRQLEAACDQALAASNLKSAFVANISHELRTPLSGIIGNLELLLGTGNFPDEQKLGLESTLGCSQSLLQIVNDLLDLSKIESGKFVIEASSFNLPELVRSILATFAQSAGEKGLSLVCDMDPQLPISVTADQGRLRQVLINLVNNAIKFTPEGEIRLKVVSEEITMPKTCQVRFEVSDTGVGISEQDQQLLFKPFSQVDSSATRKYGGAGLGLSLCKSLVQLMGGQIGVRSVAGRGSTFWFVVPVVRSPVGEVSPLTPSRVDTVGEFCGKLVLMVEDNLVVQKVVVKQLSSLGVQCLAATNGADALHMVSSARFDLIFMDCNLPDMSGQDITREIRKLEAQSGVHTPIVAMTAAAMKGDRENCLAAGMDDYLSKPVSVQQLKQTLMRWLVPSIASDSSPRKAG